MHVLYTVAMVLFAYIVGSIPSGLWICKLIKGKDFDIRKHGSNNIGATNVKRILGLKVALIVFLADSIKGLLPVVFAKIYLGEVPAALCFLGAVGGHCFSFIMFLVEGRFSGGKGVATTLGGIIAFQPVVAAIGFAVWGVILLTTKYMFFASIMGAVAAFVASFCLGSGAFYKVIFGIVSLLIVIRHLPNIVRWQHHNEPKINEKRGIKNEAPTVEDKEFGQLRCYTGAFGVHPRDLEDLLQSPLLRPIKPLIEKTLLDMEAMRKIQGTVGLRVIECGEIVGIITKTGEMVRIILLAFPFLPEELDKVKSGKSDAELEKMLMPWLQVGAEIADRRGATFLGLGGLLSTIGRGGLQLQRWVDKQQMDLGITNGGGLTAGATLEVIFRKLAERGKKLSELVVAVVGGRGVIGSAVSDVLEPLSGTFISIVRKAGERDNAITMDDLGKVEQIDLIVCCTNTPGFVITRENAGRLKPDALIIDVAFPRDVDPAIQEDYPELELVAAGLVKLSGHPVSQIDLHFGKAEGTDIPLVPACLAETVLLTISGQREHASLGSKLKPESVQALMEQAKKAGFAIEASAASEQEIFTGKADVA